MTLPKEGIPRPKLPRNFPLFLLITTAQAISFPHQVKAKVTVQDGGDGGGTNTAPAYANGGKGGDASVSYVTFLPGVQYLAIAGAGGAANSSATTLPTTPGGASSLTAKNGASITSQNGNILYPGGIPVDSGNSPTKTLGGDSLLGVISNAAGRGYGGGGAGQQNGAAGNPGAIGCILLEFING